MWALNGALSGLSVSGSFIDVLQYSYRDSSDYSDVFWDLQRFLETYFYVSFSFEWLLRIAFHEQKGTWNFVRVDDI